MHIVKSEQTELSLAMEEDVPEKSTSEQKDMANALDLSESEEEEELEDVIEDFISVPHMGDDEDDPGVSF